MRLWFVVVLAGCGRLHFDDQTAASSGDARAGDGAIGDGTQADARVFGNFAVPTVDTMISQVGNSDVGPALGNSDLELYFTSSRVGGYTLWEATRADTTQPWSAPVRLTNIDVNGPIEYDAEPSRDGLELIYGTNTVPSGLRQSTRAMTTQAWPTGAISAELPSGDRTGVSLFVDDLRMLAPSSGGAFEEYARATKGATFALINTHTALAGYRYPGVSGDGLEVFVTDVAQRLYRSTRPTISDQFSAPTRYLFGNSMIDNAMIADPELNQDGSVMYLAIDVIGGDYDIYVTTR